MGTLTATQVNNQANLLEEKTEEYVKCVNIIIKNLHEIERISKSEDSLLSRTTGEHANSYILLYNTLRKIFNEVVLTMRTYATKTIKNEEDANKKLDQQINVLDEISNSLNSLNSLSNSGGGENLDTPPLIMG